MTGPMPEVCRRRNPHTPHDRCPGTAPEYPWEPVEQVADSEPVPFPGLWEELPESPGGYSCEPLRWFRASIAVGLFWFRHIGRCPVVRVAVPGSDVTALLCTRHGVGVAASPEGGAVLRRVEPGW